MNQVMRQAGVLWQAAQEPLEDFSRSLLIGMGPIRWRRSRNQGESVEDLRFGIAGIALRHLGHGSLVRLGSGNVRQMIRIAIVRGGPFNEPSLAHCAGAQLSGMVDLC
jgi:hypothetical protein